MEFELALSLKELKIRTSKSRFKGIKLLEEKSPEIKNLSKNDLVVLSYLTKAAKLMDDVHFKLENHNNLNFLKSRCNVIFHFIKIVILNNKKV